MSSSSSAIQSVRIARLSTEVKATSKVNPPALSSSPARLASALPCSERSTSVQPVNRFSLFQMLSPWRSSTILVMGSPAIEHGNALATSPYCLPRLHFGQRRTGNRRHEKSVSPVSPVCLSGTPVRLYRHASVHIRHFGLAGARGRGESRRTAREDDPRREGRAVAAAPQRHR